MDAGLERDLEFDVEIEPNAGGAGVALLLLLGRSDLSRLLLLSLLLLLLLLLLALRERLRLLAWNLLFVLAIGVLVGRVVVVFVFGHRSRRARRLLCDFAGHCLRVCVYV